jgi:hypothetical protein
MAPGQTPDIVNLRNCESAASIGIKEKNPTRFDNLVYGNMLAVWGECQNGS